ncbi:hypothetical protein J2W58_003382 [Pseudomonas psychrotolerans]|nr:hypothetical protein [Pseudomonas psychrotolerans]
MQGHRLRLFPVGETGGLSVDQLTIPDDENHGADQALLIQGTLNDSLDRGRQSGGNSLIQDTLEIRHGTALACR